MIKGELMNIRELASCFRFLTLTELQYLCETHKIPSLKVKSTYRTTAQALLHYLRNKQSINETAKGSNYHF